MPHAGRLPPVLDVGPLLGYMEGLATVSPSPLTPTVYGLFSGNVLYILFAQSGPETGLLKSVSAVRTRLLAIGVSEEVCWIVPASSSLNSVTLTPSCHIQDSENIP